MPPDAFQTLQKHRISLNFLEFPRITASPAIADASAAHLDEDEELEEDAETVSTPSDIDLYEAKVKNLNLLANFFSKKRDLSY